MKEKKEPKDYAVLLFVLCFIGLIILTYVKIWSSEQTLLAELAQTFLLTCGMTLVWAWIDYEIDKRKKEKEKEKEVKKSFREKLQGMADKQK